MCDRFVYDVDLVYHDVRAPPQDYNRLDRHSRTVSFVHSHVRSSLAYIFSGAAQGACALRVTVGHCSMSDVSVTGVMARSSIQIDTITCNAAVSACEKGGEWPHALDILQP